MGYYDLLESWPGDYLNRERLNEKLAELGVTEVQLWDMVYLKLNPILEKITAEFHKTDEYKAQQERKKILERYQKYKKEFEDKYGSDTYDHCYDVFGELRNKAYFEEL
jgi:phosphoglycolate phosphatase-like HAD superfamily hydrolase